MLIFNMLIIAGRMQNGANVGFAQSFAEENAEVR